MSELNAGNVLLPLIETASRKPTCQQITAAVPLLAQRLDRDPTAREIAEHLGADLVEVTQALIANNAYKTDSLDAQETAHGGETLTAMVPAALTSIEQAYELMEDSISVGPLLAQLPARDRHILIMRYGQEMSQAAIGKALNISQMQVSRRLTHILTTLRSQAQEDTLPALRIA
ncbi:sigma-70 family RNA polymerase sigma factor [Nocardia sp. NPDC003693]